MVEIPDADFTVQLGIAAPPDAVYDAIGRVREWWMTDVVGDTRSVGDEFSFEVPSVHTCTLRVVQLAPGRRIVWRIVHSRMERFGDPEEWAGTDLAFELEPDGGATLVHFTHVGLSPSDDCFDVSAASWGHYLGSSLPGLVTTGSGMPTFNALATAR